MPSGSAVTVVTFWLKLAPEMTLMTPAQLAHPKFTAYV
jgi:hypothetical protein